jgi:hypothetical protein
MDESTPEISDSERPKMISTPKTDPMMRPRSPRPILPNKDQRSRLRAHNQIHPVSERRILNYYCFPNLANELHSLLEDGASFDESDTDEDSDYEFPPQTIHREGHQLPKWTIKWLKEGEQCAARELATLPSMPAFTGQEDWYGIMILPKPESEDEEDEQLDSPSRQLREELSQMSQSEAKHVEKVDNTSMVIMPSHEEVMLWVTAEPASSPSDLKRMPSEISESSFEDDELEERNRKRKRTAQEELLRRLNGKT